MLWNQAQTTTQVLQNQDVYSDVKSPFVAQSVEDTQDFSLQSIQQKLGIMDSPIEEVISDVEISPSSQTLNMNYQRSYAPAQSTAVAGGKTKVLAISYVAVALLLVLAVTLCAVSVSGSFTTASTLTSQYSEIVTNTEALVQQTKVEDYDALVKRASELGYIDVSTSNTMTYSEIETRPAQNFEVQTNWFDALCDWLTGVFGE